MTASSPDRIDPTPEQAWQLALERLQLQMARATFENWLQDTRLHSADNGAWQVAVKSHPAKAWLENQRLSSLIHRTVADIAGRAIELTFTVEESTPVWPEADPTLSPPELTPSEETNPGLAVDIRRLNRTGYQPLTNYFPLFIEPYLHHKWGTAGQKAYSLWEKLTALDGQRLLSATYANWTRPVEYRLKALAGLLAKTSIQDLTGQYGYCWQVNEARKLGQPLTDCCGQYQPGCQFRAGRHCRHWLTGILEVLSDEGVLLTEASGGRKNYHLKLQIWRSWPLLTPYQVSQELPPALRAEHQQWLERHADTLNLSFDRWAAEPARSAMDQFPDRAEGRVCRQEFRRDPFRL